MLYETARQLDPLVGHRLHVMGRLVDRVTSRRHSPGFIHVAAPGYFHRVIDLFEESLG